MLIMKLFVNIKEAQFFNILTVTLLVHGLVGEGLMKVVRHKQICY